jgi:hypothetical protein
MMVDSSRRDLSMEHFGMKLPTPVFMVPTGKSFDRLLIPGRKTLDRAGHRIAIACVAEP